MTVNTPPNIHRLMQQTICWDSHACMPLRPDDDTFLPQLARHRAAGVTLVSLNVTLDGLPPEGAVLMLASFRSWIATYPEDYVLANTVADIEAAKRSNTPPTR